MTPQETLQEIKARGLLVEIRGSSPDLAVKMVDALVAGGVTAVEVAFSTPNAEWIVETLAQRHGGAILLGVGSLTDPRHAILAKGAGAAFLSSPVCEPALIKAMVATELLVMAGAFTPTEVLGAYKAGCHVVQLFPGSLAGPAYLQALKGPFPYIPIMPAGSVDAATAAAWFDAGAVAVAAGSELCPPGLAREGRFDEITRRAAAFAAAVDAAQAGASA